jgi:hypothetical protein
MMQTDVKSAYRTTNGLFQNEAGTANLGRARLKAVYIQGNGVAEFADGTGGVVRLKISNNGTHEVLIPGQGILFENGIALTTGGVSAVTIFYG